MSRHIFKPHTSVLVTSLPSVYGLNLNINFTIEEKIFNDGLISVASVGEEVREGLIVSGEDARSLHFFDVYELSNDRNNPDGARAMQVVTPRPLVGLSFPCGTKTELIVQGAIGKGHYETIIRTEIQPTYSFKDQNWMFVLPSTAISLYTSYRISTSCDLPHVRLHCLPNDIQSLRGHLNRSTLFASKPFISAGYWLYLFGPPGSRRLRLRSYDGGLDVMTLDTVPSTESRETQLSVIFPSETAFPDFDYSEPISSLPSPQLSIGGWSVPLVSTREFYYSVEPSIFDSSELPRYLGIHTLGKRFLGVSVPVSVQIGALPLQPSPKLSQPHNEGLCPPFVRTALADRDFHPYDMASVAVRTFSGNVSFTVDGTTPLTLECEHNLEGEAPHSEGEFAIPSLEVCQGIIDSVESLFIWDRGLSQGGLCPNYIPRRRRATEPISLQERLKGIQNSQLSKESLHLGRRIDEATFGISLRAGRSTSLNPLLVLCHDCGSTNFRQDLVPRRAVASLPLLPADLDILQLAERASSVHNETGVPSNECKVEKGNLELPFPYRSVIKNAFSDNSRLQPLSENVQLSSDDLRELKRPFYHMPGTPFAHASIYFSHRRMTIPPVGFTRQAHSNGCRALGTLITEGFLGSVANDMIIRSGYANRAANEVYSLETGGIYTGEPCRLAQGLAALCRDIGFEGVLLNIETTVWPLINHDVSSRRREGDFSNQNNALLLRGDCITTAAALALSAAQITTAIHAALPALEGICLWYDSVVFHQLRMGFACTPMEQVNGPFARTTDGLFLDYHWQERHVEHALQVLQLRPGLSFASQCPLPENTNTLHWLEEMGTPFRAGVDSSDSRASSVATSSLRGRKINMNGGYFGGLTSSLLVRLGSAAARTELARAQLSLPLGPRPSTDILFGTDVWGRGTFGGGLYNSYRGPLFLSQCSNTTPLSSAIFAPAWTFENQGGERGLEANEETLHRLWWDRSTGLLQFFEPDPLSLPLSTHFQAGMRVRSLSNSTTECLNLEGADCPFSKNSYGVNGECLVILDLDPQDVGVLPHYLGDMALSAISMTRGFPQAMLTRAGREASASGTPISNLAVNPPSEDKLSAAEIRGNLRVQMSPVSPLGGHPALHVHGQLPLSPGPAGGRLLGTMTPIRCIRVSPSHNKAEIIVSVDFIYDNSASANIFKILKTGLVPTFFKSNEQCIISADEVAYSDGARVSKSWTFQTKVVQSLCVEGGADFGFLLCLYGAPLSLTPTLDLNLFITGFSIE